MVVKVMVMDWTRTGLSLGSYFYFLYFNGDSGVLHNWEILALFKLGIELIRGRSIWR